MKMLTITDVAFTDDKLVVNLADDRTLVVLLSWYPRLFHASSQKRRNWQLLGEGYAIEWPELDEHIGIEGLLAGRHSAESEQSLQRWLSARARTP
jgi:hypothetical protein